MECKDFNLLPLRKVKILILCLQAFSTKSGKAGDILTCFHTLTCWLVEIFFSVRSLWVFSLFLNSDIEPDLRSVRVYLSAVFWMALSEPFGWEAVSIFLVTISLSFALFLHFWALFRYQPQISPCFWILATCAWGIRENSLWIWPLGCHLMNIFLNHYFCKVPSALIL